MAQAVEKIFIQRILEDVDKNGIMPWQNTYKMYFAFNYFSMRSYHGINKLILPPGEYLTRKQINEYNNKNNVFYKFKKGIRFLPVFYWDVDRKEVSYTEVRKLFPDADWAEVDKHLECRIGYSGRYMYYKKADETEEPHYFKYRSFGRYYEVAERSYFVNNETGEPLPSRVATKDVVLENAKASEVIEEYIRKTGVKLVESIGFPCYMPASDTVKCNITPTTSADYYCNLFHELAHSTAKRLNRKLPYEEEECVAEICAGFCCAECGITEYSTANSRQYDNTVAYVNGWKKKIEDWGAKFIQIASEADKACTYIIGY